MCLQLDNHDTIQNEISKHASEKMVRIDEDSQSRPLRPVAEPSDDDCRILYLHFHSRRKDLHVRRGWKAPNVRFQSKLQVSSQAEI
jgi:hypothetical protein